MFETQKQENEMFSTIGQARRSCVYARTLSPFKG